MRICFLVQGIRNELLTKSPNHISTERFERRAHFTFCLFLLVADFNLSRRVGLEQLRNRDAEDAVLQTGPDAVVVDAGWEREAPSELANAAFRDPVGVLWLVFGDILASSGSDFLAGRLGMLLLM